MAPGSRADKASENTATTKGIKRYRLPALLVIGGLSLSFIIVTGKPQPQAGPREPAPAPRIDYIGVQAQPRPVEVTTQGTLESRRETLLTAQVSGAVTRVSETLARGQAVQQGEVLIQIDPRDYAIAVKEAEAQLAESRQLLSVELGRTRQAKREWRDLGSPEANDLFLRKPQLASAEAAVAAAQAKLERAQLNLGRATIKAPFAGVVNAVNTQLGQYLPAGGQIGSVIDTRWLELRLPVSSRELALLPPVGEGINAIIRGANGEQINTRITRLEGTADPQSRFLYLVADLQLPEQSTSLFAGQFVEATLTGKLFARTLRIPADALRARDQLWLVDNNQRLAITDAQVLANDMDELIVSVGGDAPALKVITSYIARPLVGMPVHSEQD